jgi:hypothetical protein
MDTENQTPSYPTDVQKRLLKAGTDIIQEIGAVLATARKFIDTRAYTDMQEHPAAVAEHQEMVGLIARLGSKLRPMSVGEIDLNDWAEAAQTTCDAVAEMVKRRAPLPDLLRRLGVCRKKIEDRIASAYEGDTSTGWMLAGAAVVVLAIGIGIHEQNKIEKRRPLHLDRALSGWDLNNETDAEIETVDADGIQS